MSFATTPLQTAFLKTAQSCARDGVERLAGEFEMSPELQAAIQCCMIVSQMAACRQIAQQDANTRAEIARIPKEAIVAFAQGQYREEPL